MWACQAIANYVQFFEKNNSKTEQENIRKIEPKEIPSCLISHLLVVFTQQREILVTTLAFFTYVKFYKSFFFSFFPSFLLLRVVQVTNLQSQIKIAGTLIANAVFFPFLSFPFPSQCCLLRFSHQIVYTNIEGTRRLKSVPTILTKTVA